MDDRRPCYLRVLFPPVHRSSRLHKLEVDTKTSEIVLTMSIISTILGLVGLLHIALANVEKTIFIAPLRQLVPDASIDNLLLISLNPQCTTARTWLNATFPTPETPGGTDTWMLLEGLAPGTRYELRICWLATQPTDFRLHTHTMDETFENPALLSSLTVFSNTRRELLDQLMIEQLLDRKHKPALSAEAVYPSLLFLRISAAADYFSLNQSLMEQVPPVFVDVILDEYIFNIFPRSLVPTAGYIVTLAIGSWFLSTFLWRALNKVVHSDSVVIDNSKKNR